MSEIEKKVQELETRMTAYEKSGFWSRRDVLKGLGAGLLGLGGAAALMKPVDAGSFFVDMNESNPQVKINNIALVKTTAGQTINVTTAAELTTTLNNLKAAPALLGNVIIQLAAGTYTGTWYLPTLIYGAYSFTIQGTLSIELDTTSGATSSADTVYTSGASALGYVTKTGAGWTANAYKNMLLYNVATDKYVPIVSNTTDTIYYVEDTTFTKIVVTTGSWRIYNHASIISGLIGHSIYGYTKLTDLKITNSSYTLMNSPYAYFNFLRCYISCTSTTAPVGALYLAEYSRIAANECIFEGKRYGAYGLGGCLLNLNSGCIVTLTTGNALNKGVNLLGGFCQAKNGVYITNTTKTAGDYGINLSASNCISMDKTIINNFDTGSNVIRNSAFVYTASFDDTLNTTPNVVDANSYYGT